MSLDRPILIGTPRSDPRTVEVCRSFAFKMNLQHYGGNPYESCDIFSSRKMQCDESARHMVGEQLFEECVEEVRASVRKVAESLQRKTAGRERGAA